MCDIMCKWQRTWTSIQPSLTRRSQSAGTRTKKEAVTEALREYIARRRQARVATLFGTVDYDPKYDYKAQRRRR